MAVERVVAQGLFSRLKSALGGIVVGLIFVVGAIVLQFWNEGRTLHRQQLLDDGRAAVVSAVPGATAALDGRLVHRSGELRAEGVRTDPDFNQIAEGLGLRRRVEMYQWKERKESREETSVGGSKTTRTTYHYDRVWHDKLIDHTRFEEPRGHENPDRMPFPSQRWMAPRVALDELQLAPEVVSEIGGWKPMAIDAQSLPANLAASFRIDGEVLTTAQREPQVGDIRVRFERLPVGPLSVVARLDGDTLIPDRRERGELLLVERGQHSAEALFDDAESSNSNIGWLLRLVGFVVLWIGFGMVFAPLSVFADIVPFFGRITRFAASVVAGVLAAFISFFAIASGWLFYRPWLLALFLIALVGSIVWLFRRRRAQGVAVPAGARDMPPPPPPGV